MRLQRVRQQFGWAFAHPFWAPAPWEPMVVQEELNLSRGVTTFTSFELSNKATPPNKPVARMVGNYILGGNLIGILLGVLLVTGWNSLQHSLRPKG